MIKPNALQKGDQVAVIAPAGPPDQEQLMQGIRVFENMGLEVIVGQHVFDEEEYIGSTDEKRLADLHEAFLDPTIRAIFCANGGIGSARLAPKVDYAMIQQNPKVFWGYSDITYLHNAIRNYSDLVTFHGAMVANLNDKDRKEETLSSFHPLFTKEPVVHDATNFSLNVVSDGEGEGKLVGGNLALLASGVGTPYQVNTDGAILLIEEVLEPAFRIDIMLTQLNQAGVFDKVEGVVIGNMQAEPDEYRKIEKVLHDFFSDVPYPVVENFQIGHC
ncbi:S66 peptidase family protein [Halobacillus locisalis]|uniref:S66 peptidase family protein n=1 Tax=Halobacillus locisalis TaxID=220753 RepID=UPI001FE32AF7|nr:LD-carboxypeptidase [Halobacillus locisalis]